MPETESSFILLDYTVLSIFAAVLAIDFLGSLYNGRAFVCEAVWHELKSAMDNDCLDSLLWLPTQTVFQANGQPSDVGWLQFADSQVNPNDDIVELKRSLSYQKRFVRGRAESLAICSNRNWIFACDDSAARRFARKKGIRLTSSIAILVKATKLEILDEHKADRIHARMIDLGYSSPLSYQYGISSYLK